MKKYIYKGSKDLREFTSYAETVEEAEKYAICKELIYRIISLPEFEEMERQLDGINKEKDEEIKRLKKQLSDKDEIIRRWKKKATSEEKGYIGQALEQGTIVKGVVFSYGYTIKTDESYTIETEVPSNMKLNEVKKYFKNRTVKEVFPELEEPERYRIASVSLRKSPCWTIQIIKIK